MNPIAVARALVVCEHQAEFVACTSGGEKHFGYEWRNDDSGGTIVFIGPARMLMRRRQDKRVGRRYRAVS